MTFDNMSIAAFKNATGTTKIEVIDAGNGKFASCATAEGVVTMRCQNDIDFSKEVEVLLIKEGDVSPLDAIIPEGQTRPSFNCSLINPSENRPEVLATL